MDKIMEKLNKLSLPAVILIASLILGGFFYASQVAKQRSIERQQEIKMAQEKKEYIAKRKMECYEMFRSEQGRVSNAEDYKYIEVTNPYRYTADDRPPNYKGDTCEIIYKDDKTGENFSKFY